MEKKKILIFTGAGVSAESGVATFRTGDDGLWYNHKVLYNSIWPVIRFNQHLRQLNSNNHFNDKLQNDSNVS